MSLLVGGALGAGAASLVARNREHRSEPHGLADLLGWAFLVNEGVVVCKDGALLAALRYRGPDLGGATAPELAALARYLNDALLPFGDGWLFHADAVRRPAPGYPESRFPSPVAGWIDAERRDAFRSARAQFVTEHKLTVTYLPPRELYARAARAFVRGGAAHGATVDWQRVLADFGAALRTIEERLESRLGVERLGSDALVTHLHGCLTGLWHPVNAPTDGAYLNTVLASQEVVGGFAPKVGALHVRCVAITEYPMAAGEGGGAPVGQLDVLDALPFAYRWSNRFIPLGRQTAERLIKRHQQQWFMGRRGIGSFMREAAGGGEGAGAERRARREEQFFHDRNATDMAQDAAAALAENASGRVRFGLATQVVVVCDEDARQADAHARAVAQAVQDRGFTARVETVNALDALFGTLPGHGYPNLRRPVLSTANVAALWPVTSVWPGLERNPSPYFPPQSPPLMHVATGGSTPFRFNLHVSDVGHTLVVGATGAGKSTFVGLTVAQWFRYPRAQAFVFDVGYSHWLLCQATGGRHYDLAAGQVDALALQPLADVDQPEERAWAAGWLESLAEMQGVRLTPQQRVRLDQALRLLAQEPRPHRTLTELTVQLQDAILVDALRPYTVAGPYGRLLDASEDALDAGDATADRTRLDVFELRHLLDLDDRIAVPTLLYLFRRVERRLDGRPTLIPIEEGWAVLMRTQFAARLKQWLLTLRKQNAAVMFVAHTPAQLEAVADRHVLVESCPTRVLLPNADAATPGTARLYRDLGLNDREVATISRAVPKRDYYVRSPLGGRLISLELGPVALAFVGAPAGMGPDELRPRVEELMDEHADAWPAAWLRNRSIPVPSIPVPPSESFAGGAAPAAGSPTIARRDLTAGLRPAPLTVEVHDVELAL